MSETALEFSEVTLRRGRRPVVTGVTLAVPRGGVYALLGGNGAGKSSLVRCGRLDGTLRPSDAASIFWLVGLGQWGALAAAGRQRRLALDAAWAAFFLVSVAMYFDLSVEEGRLGAEAAALLRDALLGLPLLVASRAQAAEGDAERAYPVFSNAAAAVAALTLLGLVAVEILA